MYLLYCIAKSVELGAEVRKCYLLEHFITCSCDSLHLTVYYQMSFHFLENVRRCGFNYFFCLLLHFRILSCGSPHFIAAVKLVFIVFVFFEKKSGRTDLYFFVPHFHTIRSVTKLVYVFLKKVRRCGLEFFVSPLLHFLTFPCDSPHLKLRYLTCFCFIFEKGADYNHFRTFALFSCGSLRLRSVQNRFLKKVLLVVIRNQTRMLRVGADANVIIVFQRFLICVRIN